MISFKPCIWPLPVNGYTTVWPFPKCNAKCICVFGFYSPFRLSCFPNLLLFFLIPLAGNWSQYILLLLWCCFFVFFKSRNRRWIRVQTQARRQHKIFNQKQVHATRYSSSVTPAEASIFQTGQMTGKMFCTRKKQKIKGKMLQKGNPAVHNWIYCRVLFGNKYSETLTLEQYSKKKTSFRNEKSWDLGNTRDRHRKK